MNKSGTGLQETATGSSDEYLISLVYRAGENAGSEQRAAEIRQALGLQTENASGGV